MMRRARAPTGCRCSWWCEPAPVLSRCRYAHKFPCMGPADAEPPGMASGSHAAVAAGAVCRSHGRARAGAGARGEPRRGGSVGGASGAPLIRLLTPAGSLRTTLQTQPSSGHTTALARPAVQISAPACSLPTSTSLQTLSLPTQPAWWRCSCWPLLPLRGPLQLPMRPGKRRLRRFVHTRLHASTAGRRRCWWWDAASVAARAKCASTKLCVSSLQGQPGQGRARRQEQRSCCLQRSSALGSQVRRADWGYVLACCAAACFSWLGSQVHKGGGGGGGRPLVMCTCQQHATHASGLARHLGELSPATPTTHQVCLVITPPPLQAAAAGHERRRAGAARAPVPAHAWRQNQLHRSESQFPERNGWHPVLQVPLQHKHSHLLRRRAWAVGTQVPAHSRRQDQLHRVWEQAEGSGRHQVLFIPYISFIRDTSLLRPHTTRPVLRVSRVPTHCADQHVVTTTTTTHRLRWCTCPLKSRQQP